MTKDEAIKALRRYRDSTFYRPTKKMLNFGRVVTYEFRYNSYGLSAIKELIFKIKQSDDDPVSVVRDMYHLMDDVLCESRDDAFEVHNFARVMEGIYGDILRYLKQNERMQKNEQSNKTRR